MGNKLTSWNSRSCSLLAGLLGLAIIGLYLISINDLFTPKAADTPVIIQTEQVVQVPSATRTPRPTFTPEPTATPYSPVPALSADAACLLNSDYGMTCLDEAGWHNIPVPDDASGHSSISNVSACGDLLIVNAGGLFGLSDGKWMKLNDETSDNDSILCIDQNHYWAVAGSQVRFYDGSAWTDFSPFEQYCNKTVLSPQGDLWAEASDSILHFDGKKWETFKHGQGWNSYYRFSSIVVDSKGNPYAANEDAILTFNGKEWKDIGKPGDSKIYILAVDAADQLWAAGKEGVAVYRQGKWQTHPFDAQRLGQPNALTFDGQGRLWVATTWGLGILDHGHWTYYHMATANLLVNNYNMIAITGKGPKLPTAMTKQYGALDGNVGTMTALKVEACVVPIHLWYGSDEETPCEGQPFIARTTTDNSGFFSLKLLPGYYTLSIQRPDGSWMILSNQSTGPLRPTFDPVSALIKVDPGGTTHLDYVSLGP